MILSLCLFVGSGCISEGLKKEDKSAALTEKLDTYDILKTYILELLVQESLEDKRVVARESQQTKTLVKKETFLSQDEAFLYDSLQNGGALYALLTGQSWEEPQIAYFSSQGEGGDGLQVAVEEGDAKAEITREEDEPQENELEPSHFVNTDDGDRGWLLPEGG